MRNFYLFAFLITLFSCQSEKYFAIKYVQNQNFPAIIYMSEPKLYRVFKTPQNIELSPLDEIPQTIDLVVSDSLFFSLKNLHDSILVNELRLFGFKVFTLDDMVQSELQNSLWQFSLKQFTIEEEREHFGDTIFFPDYTYSFDTLITAFSFNFWFELVPINNDTLPTYNFFSTFKLKENIEGEFIKDKQTDLYKYKYKLFYLKDGDFISHSQLCGSKNANYLFDFFMNQFIYFHTKTNEITSYYTYDRKSNRVRITDKERFIFLR